MKTKILTIIAFAAILSVLPVSAQDIFPLSGAKWTEVIEYDYNYPTIEYHYFSYVLQGDTIIDDILRSKLYKIPDINRRDSVLVGFMHVQGSTVFYRTKAYSGLCLSSQEVPLYDFSLSIGDSFIYTCNIYKFSVSNIDTIELLDGISRKRITFAKILPFDEYWIAGMGSVNGLFFGIEKRTISDGQNKYFVCFTQNDELIYLNPRYSECPIPKFNAIPEVKTSPLRIFPNPMKSLVTVQSDCPLQLIEIYDISGMLLYQQVCNGELQTAINRQSLLQGSCFIKVTLQTGETRTEKLIIQ